MPPSGGRPFHPQACRRYSVTVSTPSGNPHPSQPTSLREDALAVLRRLREAGHVAYFAGGCVRDLLLGLAPKDYDVATDAPPDRVRQLFTQTQAVGAAFGVILVRHRRSVIEVATFRADGEYKDGRRPADVRFTTAGEDARRRDFTINGLFLDPLDNDRVLDFVGGRADVEARVIRAIGDPERRFEEDHLRMLRAVRFAARLGFAIEPVTAEAIRRRATQLRRISPERVADELRLMLTPGGTRGAAWRHLWGLGLIGEIMRPLPEDGRQPLGEERSLFLAVDPIAPKSFGLSIATAVLCFRWQHRGTCDIRAFLEPAEAHRSIQAMRQALRISNEEAAEMNEVLISVGPLLADTPPSLAMKKRFLSRLYSPGAINLLEAIASIGLHADRIRPLYVELMGLQATEVAPAPLLTGDDLTAAGLRPGPAFKRVLDEVYDAQLEGRVATKADAVQLGLERASRGS